VSGVDEREPPFGHEPETDPEPVVASALPPRPAPAADDVTDDAGWPVPPPEPPAATGWPTTPAEIPLDGRNAFPEAQLPPEPPARAPHRHSRNPVDRLTRRLPDPLRVIVDWLVTIVGAVAIVLLVKAYVVNPYRIPSSSMEPTLHCAQPASGCEARFSDRVLANRFIYHVRDPRRGEIVVFDTPDAARVKCGAGGTFVKRLIGLPGETVEVRLRRGEGYVFVNGRELDEPYIGNGRRSTEEFGPVKVPQSAYFMMGDNRSQSCDSREWGSVPRQNLIGKVFATYWPPNRIAVR
jgi:signal peptidase I